eukprot:gene21319-27349_t
MRSCDIFRLHVTFTSDTSVKCRYSAPRLLFRCDLSSPHPTDTLLSWKHIVHGSDTSSVIQNGHDVNPTQGSESGGAPIAVAFCGGVRGSAGYSSTDDLDPVCRICQTTYSEMPSRALIKPCKCTGTLRYVHTDCLTTWRATSPYAYTTCSVCKYPYRIRTSLLARYLVNEDMTFVISLALMGPITFCVGLMSSVLIPFLPAGSGGWIVEVPYLGSLSVDDIRHVLSTCLRFYSPSQLESGSMAHTFLLGVNVLGVTGFFSSRNVPALLVQSVLFAWSTRNSVVSFFCLLTGWCTVMRELHLTLIYCLREINSWIGSIILEPS